MTAHVRLAIAAALLVVLPALAAAQANGQLQIHQLNVGQGDTALIISPLAETVLDRYWADDRILRLAS